MDILFTDLLNMSISASVIAIVIIILRLALKKSPRIFSYALWVFVLIRLLLPVSFESSFSIFNNLNSMTNHVGAPQFVNYPTNRNIPLESTISGENSLSNSKNENIVDNKNFENNEQNPKPVELNKKEFNWKILIPVFWMIGSLVYYIVLVLQDIKLRNKLKFAIHLGGNVYECDEIDIPFLYGIVKPKIYVPPNLDETQLINIVTHESIHMKRYDYIVKFISTLVLGIHWFNPILWLSYYYMCEDMEMSCDEAALRILGMKRKKSYGKTLIDLSAKPFTTTLAFSENKTESRIKNLLNYKKPKVWFTILAFLIIFLFMIPLVSNPIAYGQDYNRIKETVAYETVENVKHYSFETNKKAIDNRYSLSFTEQPNYQLLITAISKSNDSRSYFLYDTVVDKVVSTYFDVDSDVLGKKTVDTICSTANNSYVDLVVFSKLYEEGINYSNSNDNVINAITSIPEFAGNDLHYINVDRERILIQYSNNGVNGYVLYNEKTRLIEKTSTTLTIDKERLLEICEMIVEYNRQDVAFTKKCAVLENNKISCPNKEYTIPENIKTIFPLIEGKIETKKNDIYTISTSLEGKQVVMAIGPGKVIDSGQDERGYYFIIDHEGNEVYYGGLTSDIWNQVGDSISSGSQLIGYIDTGLLYFGGPSINEEMTMYFVNQEKKINVIEKSEVSYFITDEQFAAIETLFKENNPYKEYNKSEIKVESMMARPGERKDIMVTAQVNDFPTLAINQSTSEDYFLIDKAYLFKNIENNVAGNHKVDYLISISEGQYWPTSDPIMVSFRVDDDKFFDGYYNFGSKTFYEGENTSTLSTFDENILAAIGKLIDNECQKIVKIDKKVNELVVEAIRIITENDNYTNYNLQTLEDLF